MKRHCLGVAVLGVLSGCQPYAPKPLDSAAHLAEWSARSLDSDDVRQFAARLGSAPPTGYPGTPGVTDANELRLVDAELVALAFNPELRRARARAAVALAGAEHAGLWNDPSLSFDVLRVVESIPDPWVIGGVVGFTIPLSGRLGVQKALAAAEHDLELRRVAEAEWSTVARFRTTWAEWSATCVEADLVRDLVHQFDAIMLVVDRLETAQSLSRIEGRLLRMERASRRSELLLLDSRSEQLELELKSSMGLVPEAALSLQPQVAADFTDPPGDPLVILDQRSPALATRRAAYQTAEHDLHLQIRKQYPDLQIGPAYEWDEGQNKIGLGAGLPLPLLNANRQGITVARAEREAARIEYESAHERLVSAYRQAQRQLAATSAARHAIEQDLLPLAEAQIVDGRRLAELGELNVLLTLESLVRAHDVKVQLINARLTEAQAVFRLQELLGPDPRSSETEKQP